jgi:hypothetical protein
VLPDEFFQLSVHPEVGKVEIAGLGGYVADDLPTGGLEDVTADGCMPSSTDEDHASQCHESTAYEGGAIQTLADMFCVAFLEDFWTRSTLISSSTD